MRREPVCHTRGEPEGVLHLLGTALGLGGEESVRLILHDLGPPRKRGAVLQHRHLAGQCNDVVATHVLTPCRVSVRGVRHEAADRQLTDPHSAIAGLPDCIAVAVATLLGIRLFSQDDALGSVGDQSGWPLADRFVGVAAVRLHDDLHVSVFVLLAEPLHNDLLENVANRLHLVLLLFYPASLLSEDLRVVCRTPFASTILAVVEFRRAIQKIISKLYAETR